VSGERRIRAAGDSDIPAILALVRELAEYERELDAVQADVEAYRAAFFGPDPKVFATVAEQDGAVVGVAVWYVSFSTWRGRHGIFLDDLIVTSAARSQGHGRALLEHLAQICVARGYPRLDWFVLDWNEPAAGFYRSIGARRLDDWTVWRLTDDALERFGAPATG
jgi:GNAT superfamily N-acetyltransferase